MTNKIINLYIPSWIACSEIKQNILKQLKKIKNLQYFDWNLQIDFKENEIYILLEELQKQILNYFLKLKKNIIVNVYINSFSQFPFIKIFDQIASKVNKVVFINPFDQYIYFKLLSIKKNFLITNNIEGVYKYMYLCKTLNRFRNNQNWLNEIHEEVKLFNKTDLIYHKMFDQILKLNNIKFYLYWMKANIKRLDLIIGDSNPLFNFKKNKYFYNNIHIIKDCGFCLWLEQPEYYEKIIYEISKK